MPHSLNGNSFVHTAIKYFILENFYFGGAKTQQELFDYLETAREYHTGKLWVDCLIKPTLLAMNFLRAERNGDFLLIPSPTVLPGDHVAIFLLGWPSQLFPLHQLVCAPNAPHSSVGKAGSPCGCPCLQANGSTAVPADQFGEQPYIKQGKAGGGTSSEQIALWVNSFSVFSHVDVTIDQMYIEHGDEEKIGDT